MGNGEGRSRGSEREGHGAEDEKLDHRFFVVVVAVVVVCLTESLLLLLLCRCSCLWFLCYEVRGSFSCRVLKPSTFLSFGGSWRKPQMELCVRRPERKEGPTARWRRSTWTRTVAYHEDTTERVGWLLWGNQPQEA